MKKYVTLGNVLGLIGAIVALIVLGLFGHWILSTITAICILAAVWIPGNLITSWLKAAFAAVATFCGVFAITHTGVIFDGLSKALPAAAWLIPLIMAIIVAIIGCVFAWNNREYYRYNDQDDGDEEELESGYEKVCDLSLVYSKEDQTIHVWTNKDAHTVLIIFRDHRWCLDGEVDKLVGHSTKKTSIELQDGSLLRLPKNAEIEEALA